MLIIFASWFQVRIGVRKGYLRYPKYETPNVNVIIISLSFSVYLFYHIFLGLNLRLYLK